MPPTTAPTQDSPSFTSRLQGWTRRQFDYTAPELAARHRQLRAEFLGHWRETEDPEAWKKVANVLLTDNGSPPSWEAMVDAEVEIIRRLPNEALLVKHGDLSGEYRSIAGAELAAAYFARLAASKDTPGDHKRNRENEFRAEAVDMVGQIQRLRIIRRGFGKLRMRITALATSAAALFCILILAFFVQITQRPRWMPGLTREAAVAAVEKARVASEAAAAAVRAEGVALEQGRLTGEAVRATTRAVQVTADAKQSLVDAFEKTTGYFPFATTSIIFAGALGGCVSALSRVYSIPWTIELAYGVEALRHTFWGMFWNFVLSMIEGAVFAVLLYLAAMGGFLGGQLFPKFQASAGPYFHQFFESGLDSHLEFAKAIIWSFAAGFVERLVPDFLNSLRPEVRVRSAP